MQIDTNIKIVESKGYAIQSNSGRIGYASTHHAATKRSQYLRKIDKKSGFNGSEIRVSEISGFLVICEREPLGVFFPTLAAAKKRIKSIEAKEVVKERETIKGSAASIGLRMRYARETLCCMPQARAASLLGMSQAVLSRYEHCLEGRKPDAATIAKAAKTYDVSADYLLGLSDDFERDIKTQQKNGVASWLYDQLEANTVAQLNAMRVLHNEIAAVNELADFVINNAKEIGAVMDLVIAKNSEAWQDIVLGNKLHNSIVNQSAAADGIRAKLKRINLLNDIAKKHTGVSFDMFKVEVEK